MSADLIRIDVAIANRGQEVVDFVELELGGQLVELDIVDAESLERFVDELSSARDVLFTLLFAEPLANLFAGVRGPHKAQVRVEPITARPTRPFRRDDLD